MAKGDFLQQIQLSLKSININSINTLRHVIEYQKEISAVEETKEKIQGSLEDLKLSKYQKIKTDTESISFGEDTSDLLSKEELEYNNLLEQTALNYHLAKEKRCYNEKKLEIALQDQKISNINANIEQSYLSLKENFSFNIFAFSQQLRTAKIKPELYLKIITNTTTTFDELEKYVENQCKNALILTKKLLEINKSLELNQKNLRLIEELLNSSYESLKCYYDQLSSPNTHARADFQAKEIITENDTATDDALSTKTNTKSLTDNIKHIFATNSREQLLQKITSDYNQAIEKNKIEKQVSEDNINNFENEISSLQQKIKDLDSALQEKINNICDYTYKNVEQVIGSINVEQNDISLDEDFQEALVQDTELAGMLVNSSENGFEHNV